MLDTIRRHGESWLTKTLFGLLAISFISFWGYSSYRERGVGEHVAAQVGKDSIPAQQLQESYEISRQRMQEQFKDGVPEQLDEFIRNNMLEQLIQRKVVTQFAQQLGLRVSDGELAQSIRNQAEFSQDGIFDVKRYQEQFRPYYRQRFGLDYEDVLREELMLDRFFQWQEQSLLKSPAGEQVDKQINALSWNFEVIEVPAPTLAQNDANKAETEKAFQAKLQELLTHWEQGPLTKAALDEVKAKSSTVSIHLNERNKLIKTPLPEEHNAIFKLAAGQVYTHPISGTQHWYLLKLKEQRTQAETNSADQAPTKDVSDDELSQLSKPEFNADFFRLWLDEFRQHLSIKSNQRT